MVKLYRKVGRQTFYWEPWDLDFKTGIVHWGIVGSKRESKEIKSRIFLSFKKVIQAEISKHQALGYKAIEDDDLHTLLIEYKITGHGNSTDLNKRNRLIERLVQP